MGAQHCKVFSSLISTAVLTQHAAAKTSYQGTDNCLPADQQEKVLTPAWISSFSGPQRA